MYSVWISEQTATFALYSINWTVFKTECVHCAVRTESLHKTDTFCIKKLISKSTRCPWIAPWLCYSSPSVLEFRKFYCPVPIYQQRHITSPHVIWSHIM